MLIVPSNALAQRDAFFADAPAFYKSLGGAYGDEGPQLVAQLDALTTALARWDDEILAAEQQAAAAAGGSRPQTTLQVHTLLASMYMERGRFDDALREFDEDIRIDPRRAAFHRFKGLIHAGGRGGPRPRMHSARPGCSTRPIPRTPIDSWPSGPR